MKRKYNVKFELIGNKVKYTLPVRMYCNDMKTELSNSMTLTKDDCLLKNWLGDIETAFGNECVIFKMVDIYQVYDKCDAPMKKEDINIEIERYTPEVVKVYKSNGDYYGELFNEHELNRFRIKMLEENVVDCYYFLWNDIKITMDNKGNLSDWPRGMYDQTQTDLRKIFQLTRNI